MINLLSSGFSKLFGNAAFRIGTALMALLPVVAALFTYFDEKSEKAPLNGVYNVGLYLIWLLIGAFVSIFIGQDYDEKIINNKIMSGHSRASIYAADYIVTLSGALIMQLTAIITGSAVAVPLFGMFTEPLRDMVLSQFIVVCILAVYTAVVLLVTTVINSKSYAQGASMFIVLAMFIIGNSVYDRVVKLRAKAEKEDIAVTELVKENSLTDILYNCMPQSQADIVMEGGLPENAGKMVCCDLASVALLTSVGLIVFGRKDIK